MWYEGNKGTCHWGSLLAVLHEVIPVVCRRPYGEKPDNRQLCGHSAARHVLYRMRKAVVVWVIVEALFVLHPGRIHGE